MLFSADDSENTARRDAEDAFGLMGTDVWPLEVGAVTMLLPVGALGSVIVPWVVLCA